MSVVGRLAPSPTGAQHVGNARTYLLAWLSARSRGGRLILRMEDIETPRIKPGADRQAIEDLRWLGLDWDEGPDLGGPSSPYVQTERADLYRSLFEELKQRELVYPCTCSRKDVIDAAGAPHGDGGQPPYPGRCAHRSASEGASLAPPFCWRFRTEAARTLEFDDLVLGRQAATLASFGGDFVAWTVADSPSYQLAVVADDHAMGVTEAMRGDDLVPSTLRQLLLYEAFAWTPPAFAHVPLVVGPDRRRLAKRHGDTRLSKLRSEDVKPEALLGLLAHSAGLIGTSAATSAAELLPLFEFSRITRSPFTLMPDSVAGLRTA